MPKCHHSLTRLSGARMHPSSWQTCSRLSDFDPLRMNFSATPSVRTTTKARQDEMCEIVCRAAVGVATKESSPPCVTTSVTKHDEKSWKREYPQVERAIHQYLGRAALFQARISGDVHERTKQAGEGGKTKKRVGEPCFGIYQRHPYYLIRFILHYIQPVIPFHIIIPLIYRADL